MKLIIRQYLASLKERGELDAILPDLLSELGLNVYSRPSRGTRQDGVDVAAVGKLEGDDADKVYLFSIKAGDLTRSDWDGNTSQALRPSLNEIRDTYIPNRLPVEHRDKEIVICICLGGEIKENVSTQVEGYIRQFDCGRPATFQNWNGDKLADLIQSSFLREELLPEESRSQLRKALALLDEPEASYRYFSDLIRSLGTVEGKEYKEQLTALRQMNICLWVLYAWARDVDNIESAYLSGELTLLHGWKITRTHFEKSTKIANSINETFSSLISTYHQICDYFLTKKVLPFVDKRHALSVAVGGSCNLDINLRMFDILGRLALGGLWLFLSLRLIGLSNQEMNSGQKAEMKEVIIGELRNRANAIKDMLSNNPTLFLPIKDSQVTDIAIAIFFLMIEGRSENDIRLWLDELMQRATFYHQTNGKYPCNIESYSDLLDHPQGDENYLTENTCGSVLYPTIGLWANIYGDEQIFERVKTIKSDHLQHCNFQLWFPDDTSEQNLYTDTENHGAMLSDIEVKQPLEAFADQIFRECDHSPHFKGLSAIKYGFWPLILVACRHYRLPVPVHFFKDFSPDASTAPADRSEEPAPKTLDK